MSDIRTETGAAEENALRETLRHIYEFKFLWHKKLGWILIEPTGEYEENVVGEGEDKLTFRFPKTGETCRDESLSKLVEKRFNVEISDEKKIATHSPPDILPPHKESDTSITLNLVGPSGPVEVVVDPEQDIPEGFRSLDIFPLIADQIRESLGGILPHKSTILFKREWQWGEDEETFSSWRRLDTDLTSIPMYGDKSNTRKQLKERLERLSQQESIEIMTIPPAGEQLTKLKEILPKGNILTISVGEGNIATGESGWQILLQSRRMVRELACDYDLDQALTNAVKSIEDLLS